MLASVPAWSARVDQLLAKLPAFSPVAMKLMAIISDENVSFKEVARLISMDPAISGEVLKLANSGFYGRRASVHSIVHAIALVGIRRVSPIVITAAIWKALPRQPSASVKGWWRHSIAAALIAEHISREGSATESAYTASLLHDIGQLALIQYSPDQYARMVEHAGATGTDLLESERHTFGFDHAQLSALILDKWYLPLSIQDAVASHHAEISEPSLLATVVQTGCFASEYVGFGTCGCHNKIAAAEIPPAVLKLLESKYLLEVLPQEVNGIECSLL